MRWLSPYPGAMSTAPTPEPSAEQPQRPPEPQRPHPGSLIFDDPLDQRSSDDTDHCWGERPVGTGGAADLARFLDEKPPHHI